MYKVGDEVVLPLKIEKICNEELVGAKSEADITYLFKIEEANRVLKPRESKTYEQGLTDAWELAKKICALKNPEFDNVFGCVYFSDAFYKFTPEEALAKIEAYEKEKEIKAGDVVYGDDEPDSFGVVTLKDSFGTYVMWKDGSSGRDIKPESLRKTGKHIDIESLLRQIGE